MPGYLTAMRRFADYRGRSRRSEFWLFSLVAIGIHVALGYLLSEEVSRYSAVNLAIAVVMLAHIAAAVALSARRLHDLDRSGWWQISPFVIANVAIVLALASGERGEKVTLAGIVGALGTWLVLLAAFALRGAAGPNAYGADPLGDAPPLADRAS